MAEGSRKAPHLSTKKMEKIRFCRLSVFPSPKMVWVLSHKPACRIDFSEDALSWFYIDVGNGNDSTTGTFDRIVLEGD